MEIILGLAFVSLVFVAGALLSFGYSVREGDHEQAERLALLPLADDLPPKSSQVGPVPPKEKA